MEALNLKELRSHIKMSYSPKIAPTPVGSVGVGIFLTIFALPFMAGGTYLVGAYLKQFPIDMSKVHVPMEVLAAIGVVVFLAGLSVFVLGFKNILQSTSTRGLKSRYPDSPWKWDTHWNEKGVFNSSGKGIIHHLFGLVLIGGLFAPFFYIMTTKESFPMIFKIMVPAMFLLFATIAIYNLLKSLKYQGVKSLYLQFPFHLGQELPVEVHGMPHKNKIEDLKIHLRCIQAKVETKRRGNKSETSTAYYVVHHEEQQLDPSFVSNGVLRSSLPTPKDSSLTTDFESKTYQFWELRVTAKTPGIDFDYGFLVPLYK